MKQFNFEFLGRLQLKLDHPYQCIILSKLIAPPPPPYLILGGSKIIICFLILLINLEFASLAAIDVIEYARSRAAELQLLDEATKKRKVSQAVNGLMSISMRRRAMSHNVKRMPRRVREV